MQIGYKIMEVIPNSAQGTIGFYEVRTSLINDQTCFESEGDAVTQIVKFKKHDPSLYPLTIVKLYMWTL